MSDDWFDKTYRSEGTPPADLDARILRRARRATRRWAGSLVVAGIFTVAVALILAIVLANIELDVPPTEREPPRGVEPPPAAEADCQRSLELVGPFGGPGRQDRAEICLTATCFARSSPGTGRNPVRRAWRSRHRWTRWSCSKAGTSWLAWHRTDAPKANGRDDRSA